MQHQRGGFLLCFQRHALQHLAQGKPRRIAQLAGVSGCGDFGQQAAQQCAHLVIGHGDGLRYPIPPYGVQNDVRAGMAASYGAK